VGISSIVVNRISKRRERAEKMEEKRGADGCGAGE
jgi:hypothetical protein